MKVCIIGAGAAGWLTCHQIKNLNFIEKIYIIGSNDIPTIGVGESTSINFYNYIDRNLNLDESSYKKFLTDIDATRKYGVYYDGWSKNNFLHPFIGSIENDFMGYNLGKIPAGESVEPYYRPFSQEIYQNKIFLDDDIHKYSFHFDAGKFISAMTSLAEKDLKIEIIRDTVIDRELISEHEDYKKIQKIVLKSGRIIEADYFIGCTGQTEFNQKIFENEYVSYEGKLFVDKAVFFPLNYKNKKQEMKAYTTARTMNCGWRWIIPTWSRIGTGYNYSSKHLTVGQAIDEFRADIGDKSIEPFQLDFFPRRVKTFFHSNYCSLGMASGFLEPLDSPSLGITLILLGFVDEILTHFSESIVDKKSYTDSSYLYFQALDKINEIAKGYFDFFAVHIRSQYKNCSRIDTDFWKDVKESEWDFYDQCMYDLLNPKIVDKTISFDNFIPEPYIIYNTLAGKNVRWNVNIDMPLEKKNIETDKIMIDHFDYFDSLHKT